ncbi:tannase/feruloyl esterase family alpha/beta hydrolase [Marinimicrobium sp. LS-A18]|uniref:tannase/feruloyl esterase family alpha/beta hydrolase n=1 Tax=Marinimicrobium sp. LS-A18 TaxID=1381596 RepID=UPI001EE71792|nr:tannase/feruloyl esterase family alpha/beta hydrolase [Marinimicrobium sp. LS-A18]
MEEVDSCAEMASMVLDNASSISANSEVINKQSPQGNEALTQSVCQLQLQAFPVKGSTIGIEIWLPESGWNGKLQMVGNGGYSARIDYAAFKRLLRRGYAVVGTDTGHEGDDPSFAAGRPEAIKDWSYRAVHVSVVHAKRLVEAFYGQPAQYSYFSGCSTGGHQGLMAAQRYPQDFDGIIVGAPGHNRTHLNAGFLWQFVKNRDPENTNKALLSSEQLKMVSAKVLEVCQKNNGAVSGGVPQDTFLNNPYHCDFAPGVLTCPDDGKGGKDCLSEEQVRALDNMYSGAHNPRTGERIYFGNLPGTEAAGGYSGKVGWSLYWADPNDPSKPARESFWQHWAFPGESWRWQDFDFDRSMRQADDQLAAEVNAMNADLSGFLSSGGKLLHYHGLNDPVVPATDSISYHNRVVDAAKTSSWGNLSKRYRLYLMPGVNHCGGGAGPGQADFQTVLEKWVEQGADPDRIVARGGSPEGETSSSYERPLCPYPEFAYYDGAGNPKLAASFVCRRPDREFQVPRVSADYLR